MNTLALCFCPSPQEHCSQSAIPFLVAPKEMPVLWARCCAGIAAGSHPDDPASQMVLPSLKG